MTPILINAAAFLLNATIWYFTRQNFNLVACIISLVGVAFSSGVYLESLR
jgi:hypothetical protein